jgi:hypothetical protein
MQKKLSLEQLAELTDSSKSYIPVCQKDPGTLFVELNCHAFLK